MSSEKYLVRFTNHLLIEKSLSEKTVKAYTDDVKQFFVFCQHNKLVVEEVNLINIRKYLALLYSNGLARNSISRKMTALRIFYKFMHLYGFIENSPVLRLTLPKSEKRLPNFLYGEEVNAILDTAELQTPLDLRDKSILEVLYSSGIRVGELVALDIDYINWQECSIKVFGKRNKERIVPMSAVSLHYLRIYCYEARQKISSKITDRNALFLNKNGGRLTDRSVRNIVKKYFSLASINKKASPHTFRHSYATHMLDNGADLRSVQELLGHAQLSTTQIYTHFTKSKIKQIYDKSHPRA